MSTTSTTRHRFGPRWFRTLNGTFMSVRFSLVLGVGIAAALPGWPLTAGTLTTVETAAALEPTLERLADLPRMRSILVSVDGDLRAEQYFHGATPNRTANLKSASKSIISVLVGIAIDRALPCHLFVSMSKQPRHTRHNEEAFPQSPVKSHIRDNSCNSAIDIYRELLAEFFA